MNIMSETRPATIAIGPAVARFGRVLLAALRRWRLRRQTGASLRSLDDHLLRDIGLRRDHSGRVFRP
jgi:uncharacterized protein YjiS (DUF1127 family)